MVEKVVPNWQSQRWWMMSNEWAEDAVYMYLAKSWAFRQVIWVRIICPVFGIGFVIGAGLGLMVAIFI